MAGAVGGRLEDDDKDTRDERGSEGLRERERPGESIIEREIGMVGHRQRKGSDRDMVPYSILNLAKILLR